MADKLSVALRFSVTADVTVSSGSLGVPTNVSAKLQADDLQPDPATLVPTAPLQIRFKGPGTIIEIGGAVSRSP